MKKILIGLTLFVLTVSANAQIQYGGQVRALNNAGTIGLIGRTNDNLKVWDSLLNAKIPTLTLVGSALKVDGSAVTQPISAVSLPLPTSASTSTKQSDGSQKTQIVDGSGNVIGATTNALDINIKSGNPTSMPVTNTGTFAVQATIAASSTSIGKAEDVASADADVGSPAMFVRKATPANTSGSDGDYEFLQGSAGRLWVDASGVTLTVGSHAVTNAGTFATQSTLQANSGVDIGKLTANQSVNVSQINAVTPLMGNGITGTGSQRVTIASDNTAFPVNATLQSNTGVDIGKLTANQSVNVSQINGVTPLMGSGIMGTGSQRVTIASDNDPLIVKQATAANLNATVVGTGTFAAQVDLNKINGTTIVNGGVAGSQSIGGTVATNVAITANPINLGAQGVSSENAVVTTARQVQLVADLVGKLIVLPYANPENFVSGAISSAMTGTTTTSLLAAPASGLRNYITQITVSNSHATVGTDVLIQDGSGGTTLYVIPAGAVYGGATITFPTPLRQPTTATAIFAQDVTTGAAVKVSASGYIGK